jgi:hypothetical protein
MSQQSDTADLVCERLRSAPFPLAWLVRELRAKWGDEHRVLAVHGLVREVATCLLHREDVEVGDLHEGRFVPWQTEAWHADERIDTELMAMTAFLDDEARYVFQKKEPNHSVEANRRPAAPLEAGHRFGSSCSARPSFPAAVARLWR